MKLASDVPLAPRTFKKLLNVVVPQKSHVEMLTANVTPPVNHAHSFLHVSKTSRLALTHFIKVDLHLNILTMTKAIIVTVMKTM